MSVLLVLATVALFVGGLFEETAFVAVVLLCLMPFVWYLGVRTGLAAGGPGAWSRGGPQGAGEEADDS